MSAGRKRSRKSKLEIREDCDLEVVASDDTATASSVQKRLKEFHGPKDNYNTEITIVLHDHAYYKFANFNYEYMKANSAINARKNLNTDSDVSSLWTKFKKVKQSQISYQLTSSRVLRKMDLNVKTPESKDSGTIRMCKYELDKLFKESQRISETSDNIADKILNIEIRNLWGRVTFTPHKHDAYDVKLIEVIELWQSWTTGAKYLRGPPLFYQCHICTLAWWTLRPFREHIKTHNSETLLLFFREHLHESFIIASTENVDKLIYIPIEDNCFECGENVEYHKSSVQGYVCKHCQKYMYTCSALRDHKTSCFYWNLLYNNIDPQCPICETVLDNDMLKDKHMIEAHSVRSDLPSPEMLKPCNNCDIKYAIYKLHDCPKSVRNSNCVHCFRKFAGPKFALAHVDSDYNKAVKCKICNLQLKAKCQEVQHLLADHTDNYKLVYRCTLCTEDVLYLDDTSIKLHRIVWHSNKLDKRKLLFDKMLVPKTFLEGDNLEELFVPKKMSTENSKNNCNMVVMAQTPEQVSEISTEVEIKKEPVDLNDEDYEEMLLKMFNQPSQSTKRNKRQSDKNNVKKHTETKEVDFDINVKIKTEPVDEIEITENPIVIKTEPIDEDDIEAINFDATIKVERQELDGESMAFTNDCVANDIGIVATDKNIINPNESIINAGENIIINKNIMNPNENIINTDENINNADDNITKVVVKTEKQDTDEMLTFANGVVIKQEIDDTSMETEESFDYKLIITDRLSDFENEHITTIMGSETKASEKTKWQRVSAEDLADQYSVDVLNSKGKVKQKKLYTCAKCGYTAHHKKYQIHKKNSKCNPNSNSHYPCTKCGLNFFMFTNYVIHFEKHGYDVSTCFICGLALSSTAVLNSHVRKHIKNSFLGLHMLNKSGEELPKMKKGTCQVCHKTLDRHQMFAHWEGHLKLKDHAPQTPIKTEVEIKEEIDDSPELTIDCERVTINNKELGPAALKLAIEHLQADSNEKECIICYRLFSRRYDLKRHLVEHLLMDARIKKLKLKEFRCQICGYGSSNMEKYKFHMRGHGGMPIFMCELCNKTFSDSSNFAKHKKTHNVRCLVCDICKKKFHSKLFLTKHILDHSKTQMLKCSACPKTFHTKSALKKHRHGAHLKPKYTCSICDVIFNSLRDKWVHDWEVHEERKHAADCPICRKSFRKFSDVKSHARVEHGLAVSALREHGARGAQVYTVAPSRKQKETLIVTLQ